MLIPVPLKEHINTIFQQPYTSLYNTAMVTHPIPPLTLSSPRLHIVRLTDTSEGSQHVQWFHENWSDAVATSWSLHGSTKTLEESRLWMIEHMTKWDNWFYSIFLRKPDSPELSSHDVNMEDMGEHIGSVSLRSQATGPTLLPPMSFQGAEEVGIGAPLTEEEEELRKKALEKVDLELRVLGYALFESAWGKGYITEACKILLDGYSGAIEQWKASKGGKPGSEKEAVFYVEAGVDVENPGSQRVLRKLGFKTAGMKVEKEKAWLNGGWRGPGWWITGLYL